MIFVVTTDFDGILRDITEFRGGFLDYEKLTAELIRAVNGRGEVFRETLSQFDDMRFKIGVYQAENRLPDDELENFYKKLTKRFARFWTGLVDEWAKTHCG